jgi:hypothetical protein
MKKYYYAPIILLLLVMSSCKSTYVGGYSAIPNVSIDYNIKADLKIDTTRVLQATSTTKIYFNLLKIGDNTFSDAFGGNVGDREKSAATYKALFGTGLDIIVNPKYIVNVTRGLFIKQIDATVAGYGAKIHLK